VEFLDAALLDPIRNSELLVCELSNLASLAKRSANSEALRGAGRNKAAVAITFSTLTYCAILIAETWKYLHGAEPPPRNKRAQGAAEALWLAAGGEHRSWGNKPLNRWRYHFEMARKQPAEALRADYHRHLAESDRMSSELLSA
jgi:hypothetical protein